MGVGNWTPRDNTEDPDAEWSLFYATPDDTEDSYIAWENAIEIIRGSVTDDYFELDDCRSHRAEYLAGWPDSVRPVAGCRSLTIGLVDWYGDFVVVVLGRPFRRGVTGARRDALARAFLAEGWKLSQPVTAWTCKPFVPPPTKFQQRRNVR